MTVSESPVWDMWTSGATQGRPLGSGGHQEHSRWLDLVASAHQYLVQPLSIFQMLAGVVLLLGLVLAQPPLPPGLESGRAPSNSDFQALLASLQQPHSAALQKTPSESFRSQLAKSFLTSISTSPFGIWPKSTLTLHTFHKVVFTHN